MIGNTASGQKLTEAQTLIYQNNLYCIAEHHQSFWQSLSAKSYQYYHIVMQYVHTILPYLEIKIVYSDFIKIMHI